MLFWTTVLPFLHQCLIITSRNFAHEASAIIISTSQTKPRAWFTIKTRWNCVCPIWLWNVDTQRDTQMPLHGDLSASHWLLISVFLTDEARRNRLLLLEIILALFLILFRHWWWSITAIFFPKRYYVTDLMKRSIFMKQFWKVTRPKNAFNARSQKDQNLKAKQQMKKKIILRSCKL